MSRHHRHSLAIESCLAATALLGLAPACDRSSPPPSKEPSAVAPADSREDAQAAKPAAQPNENATRPETLPISSADSVPPVGPTSDPARTADASAESAAGGFVPPEVDISSLSDFEQEAINNLRKSVIAAPGSADRVAELGMWYCVRDHPKEAAKCFEQACKVLPGVMHYRYLLAIAYEEAEMWPESIEAYHESIALDGAYAAAYCNLGRLLLNKDDLDAKAMFEKALELDPSDSISEWGLGQIAERSGDTKGATARYEKAIELQPNYKDAHYALSKILQKAGRTEEAREHLTQYESGRKGLVRNDPIRYELTTRKRGEREIAEDALAAAREGKIKEARRFLIRTMQKGMIGAPIRTALGEVFLLERRYDEALMSFQEALKLEPDSRKIKTYIAVTLIELGEFDAAEPRLNEILNDDPTNHLIVNRLGYLSLKRGRPQEAEPLLRRAIELAPGKAGYQMNLAECLAAMRQTDAALAAAEKAAELDKENPSPFLFIGQVRLDSGQAQDAEVALKRAIAINPKLEIAYTSLAGAARARNDFVAAVGYLEDGHQAMPESTAIANDLAFSLATCPTAAKRDPKRAIEIARRICDAEPNANYLDTLATAYAAADEVLSAVDALGRAIAQARLAGANKSVIQDMESRLDQLKTRLPKP